MSDYHIPPASDVIDSYFIESDLVEIHQSDAEISESADLDAACNYRIERSSPSDIPIGKQVK